MGVLLSKNFTYEYSHSRNKLWPSKNRFYVEIKNFQESIPDCNVRNKDISIRDNKFEEKFLLENIYLYHYLYEHII